MILPFLISCEYVALTDEQQAYVEQAYVGAGLEKDVVVALGDDADFVYGASATGHTSFAEDHERSYVFLQQFYEENHINGFDPTKHSNYETSSAVLMRDIFGTPTSIGINIEDYTTLTSDELMHEAGHSLQEGHDSSLDALFDDGFIYSDQDISEQVLALHDFPYLLSYLYVTADWSLYYNQRLPPESAETEEVWAEKVAGLYTHIPFLSLLGITQEEYKTILVDSNFYEMQEDL
ncbi:MAG: hypothetical protein AABX82_00510 [Nanoarchaeota archaeon]